VSTARSLWPLWCCHHTRERARTHTHTCAHSSQLIPATVSLSRPSTDVSFGFGIATTVVDVKVVCHVAPHSVASRRLKTGDIIDTANAHKLASLSHDGVIDILAQVSNISHARTHASHRIARNYARTGTHAHTHTHTRARAHVTPLSLALHMTQVY
jgi:hypothetical protein